MNYYGFKKTREGYEYFSKGDNDDLATSGMDFGESRGSSRTVSDGPSSSSSNDNRRGNGRIDSGEPARSKFAATIGKIFRLGQDADAAINSAEADAKKLIDNAKILKK